MARMLPFTQIRAGDRREDRAHPQGPHHNYAIQGLYRSGSETEQSSRADSRNSTANRSIGLLGVMWYLLETSRIGDGLER
jgi:hypothetical protein